MAVFFLFGFFFLVSSYSEVRNYEFQILITRIITSPSG